MKQPRIPGQRCGDGSTVTEIDDDCLVEDSRSDRRRYWFLSR